MSDAGLAYEGRLRLRNSVTGNQLRFTEAATQANGWSFPMHIFEVKNLNGQYVGVIGDDNVEKKEKIKICAVLTRGNEVAPGSYSLSEVHQHGWVLVLAGNEILPFPGLKHTCKQEADLSLVETPKTPSSCSDNEVDLADLPGLWDTTGNWKVCPKTIHLS